MTTTEKATPRPWNYNHSDAPDWEGDWYILSQQGNMIVMGEGNDDESKANAALIVRAVNLFEALNAVAKAAEVVENSGAGCTCYANPDGSCKYCNQHTKLQHALANLSALRKEQK